MPAPSFRKRPELCLGKASQSPSCVLDTCSRERCPPAEVPVPPVSPGSLPVPLGCFVSGLYLEGADWDIERGCLVKSKAKVLVVDLPILKVIPIEAHRLKLQVRGHGAPLPRLSADWLPTRWFHASRGWGSLWDTLTAWSHSPENARVHTRVCRLLRGHRFKGRS